MAEDVPRLSHRAFLKMHRNYEKAASVVKLVYVKDTDPGISRTKKGKGFRYTFNNCVLTDKKEIERIRKLAIPPAWSNVWICALPNGHIQATGHDLRKRKQYRYHAVWQVLRSETKFHRLLEFGKVLGRMRLRVERDLRCAELTQEKVLAAVISLMERTYMRVGSNEYERMYGSYGLTTLKDKHVEISGDKLAFSFKGKKGIVHNISLRNKKLAHIVKQCRDIPGKELFQYYDADGKRQSIDSGMVNDYIRSAAEMDFTAKDFRTWAGTLHALQEFFFMGEALTDAECKKNIVAVLDQVSQKLGNTRMVCKKYYVHPGIIQLYQEKKLLNWLGEPAKTEELNDTAKLTRDEEILMKILVSLT